jgi:arylsulfatase A-like enzyme
MPVSPSSAAWLLARLAALALLSGCGTRTVDGAPHGVLVVAIDGLRADHLGLHGYDRDTSPTLSALAAEGGWFEQAFASAPQLLPAHAAVLTGCEPTVARRFLAPDFEGWSERRWRIPERGPHLAVELLAAGYATAAFVDEAWLVEAHGFDRGFQRYDIVTEASAAPWEGGQTRRVIERFLQWQRELPADRPWFAYLHLNRLERSWSDRASPAESYFQPREELDLVPPVANTDSVFFAVPRSRWAGGARTLGQYEAAYDDELRRMDQELERLLAGLRRDGRYDATSIHVLGTYGMQLGEAGLYLCAGRYSPFDLRVPWIARPRSALGGVRGQSLPALVSLIDLAPTVLALEGLTVPTGMHGLSQADALLDGPAAAPARPFVFASCGLQEGCAVIGEHHVLEYLFPLGSSDAQQRRSWLGEWSELSSLQPRLAFYLRTAGFAPPLEPATPAAPDPRINVYRAAAVEWMRDLNDVRLLLHAPPGESGLDEATLERLRAKGFLARPPK